MVRVSRLFSIGLAYALVGLLPATASAQGFLGIGPRISFIRGDVDTNTPSQQLFGVSVRLKASPRVAFEGTLDYRSETSTDMTQRVTDMPLQGSLFLYPVRSTISPYLLAGIGVYPETTDTLNASGTVTSSTTTRKTGWHAGFGGELAFGKQRHVSAFADYRYRFVSLDSNGTAVIPGTNLLKISHQGSMWTGGLIFYF